jgi:hypothetical protein
VPICSDWSPPPSWYSTEISQTMTAADQDQGLVVPNGAARRGGGVGPPSFILLKIWESSVFIYWISLSPEHCLHYSTTIFP